MSTNPSDHTADIRSTRYYCIKGGDNYLFDGLTQAAVKKSDTGVKASTLSLTLEAKLEPGVKKFCIKIIITFPRARARAHTHAHTLSLTHTRGKKILKIFAQKSVGNVHTKRIIKLKWGIFEATMNGASLFWCQCYKKSYFRLTASYSVFS